MSQTDSHEARGRILIADDEPELLRALSRLLRGSGYEVDTAANGHDALSSIARTTYDAVLSDIAMPGLDGIELLKALEEQRSDVPVILVTGAPAVETAIEALEHGAYKYLLKPVDPERLEEVVQKAVQLSQMARIRREAAAMVASAAADPALQASFDSAMASLWMAYQPIVRANGTLYGHEALLRSREPKLPHPGAVLDAAEKLDRLSDLGRRVRTLAAAPVASQADSGMLFVNLHPCDLEDPELTSPDSALARIADRVVLEVTERASLASIQDLRQRVVTLRQTGYRIAIDDLGAGYAGLTSFALLEPEIVKIDMTLVRDVDRQPMKQRLVRSITSLCAEMGIEVVGEGVETEAERDTLVELGCDLLQGYYLARPAEPFPAFRW